jgi:pimeloyl-ACP methyl ester carboxylesterase
MISRFAILTLFGFIIVGGSYAQTAISSKEAPAKLETPTGTIYGTLLVPGTKPKYPVVLIIAGSGPTDRNGNSPLLSGHNDSLKLLAEGLAANGIASLRYDKRGIAESAKAMKSEAEIRFEDYIDDAVLWCKQLRQDKRFSTLTIAGHSEGSLIGMVAAQKAGVDGYVSIAGIGRPADDILRDQLKPKLPPDLMKATDAILASLMAGKAVDEVPPQLAALFRPSVQPYLISWFRYDPSKEIAKLKVPVLIVQGTTDIQVSVKDAKLLATAAPASKLKLIEGMNHVLKQVPDDKDKQIASYSDPDLPVARQLIDQITKFARKLKPLRSVER